jgi:hypothetical protein
MAHICAVAGAVSAHSTLFIYRSMAGSQAALSDDLKGQLLQLTPRT